ncbi:hypothetical protein G6F63_014435 [Rhizopus arrhizus]|nr:hypothetical protein G6F63_014435 [Rhizopus arrhizus]
MPVPPASGTSMSSVSAEPPMLRRSTSTVLCATTPWALATRAAASSSEPCSWAMAMTAAESMPPERSTTAFFMGKTSGWEGKASTLSRAGATSGNAARAHRPGSSFHRILCNCIWQRTGSRSSTIQSASWRAVISPWLGEKNTVQRLTSSCSASRALAQS